MAGPDAIGKGEPLPLIVPPSPPVACEPPDVQCEQIAYGPDACLVADNGSADPSLSFGLEPKPAPKWMLGRTEYYRWRLEDFRARHPGKPAPDYYLHYGEKYAERFSRETAKELSPAGQAWLARARLNLQVAFENLRNQDPQRFEQLERDPDAFRSFAFRTHAKAYLDAGIAKLPMSDWVTIGLTPDTFDLLQPEGIEQAYEVLEGIVEEEMAWLKSLEQDAKKVEDVVEPFVVLGGALIDGAKIVGDLFE